MAITKLGAQILGGIEKTGLAGQPDPGPQPSPTMWYKMGKRVVGPAMSVAVPGLIAFGTVNGITSGEQSLGGSLGGLGGGIAGWSLGNKAFNSLSQKIQPLPAGRKAGFLRGGLGFAAGMLGSMIGDGVGSSIGHVVLPFQRKPKNFQDYWQEGYNGWSVQPDAY